MSLRMVAPVALAVLLLGACAENPEKAAQHLDDTEPNAVKTAKERARVDLGCEQIETKVTERQAGETRTYGLNRSVFRVATSGCGRAQSYSVACGDEGDCSAMMEGGAPVK